MSQWFLFYNWKSIRLYERKLYLTYKLFFILINQHVLLGYDWNNVKTKTSITARKLFSSLITVHKLWFNLNVFFEVFLRKHFVRRIDSHVCYRLNIAKKRNAKTIFKIVLILIKKLLDIFQKLICTLTIYKYDVKPSNKRWVEFQ